jgi:hypothetical protein
MITAALILPAGFWLTHAATTLLGAGMCRELDGDDQLIGALARQPILSGSLKPGDAAPRPRSDHSA